MAELKENSMFTWADLKMIVNKIPESKLKDRVTIWTDDEKCYTLTSVSVLKEHYRDDGDLGVLPHSVMAKSYEDFKEGVKEGDYQIVYPKGTRIMNAE